jgi:SAM-dependent methyltransferase
MKIFYRELAPWWPLVSPVGDYAEEAQEFLRILDDVHPAAKTLLELGSGGGHNAFHMKARFELTLSDLNQEMLDVSLQLNPECAHIAGDMRTLDLGRAFDVVFVHDAIDYMTTEDELGAALATAYRHCKPGGVALFVPDSVKEHFEPSTDCGGADHADGRGLRYLEWSYDPEPSDNVGTTQYAFLVRDLDGSVRVVNETHTFGLFSRTKWNELLLRSGFEAEAVVEQTGDDREPRLIFVARRPSLQP